MKPGSKAAVSPGCRARSLIVRSPSRVAVARATASAYVLAKPSGSLIVRPSGRSRERSASIVVTDASFRMARLIVPVYSG